ncbi:MAG: hypothetical protein RLZZ387_1976 [Chloroflexota bacterium]
MRARSRYTAAGIALCIFLTALLAAFVRPSMGQQAAGDLQPDQVVLVLEKSAELSADAEHLWPPTAAAQPFSHILIRREASVPPGASLALFVRASVDGAAWSHWEEVVANDDLYVPEDGPDVLWSQIVDVGAMAHLYQVRAVVTPSPEGGLPELRRVEVNTVDALSGPDIPADMPRLSATEKLAGKPAVVSRTQWGSPDGQSSRATVKYAATTHIVVHHTADSSTLLPGQTSWAARVRAIWSFHAITRGWGDIGYNYLIDPNGVIYEGRAGGDDAVGFHDTGNFGSMGVAMLGTYTSAAPAQATLDSLVRLMAWKADQKDIDPNGRSYYRGCDISSRCKPFNADAVVPNIAGHRQVTPGHTTCPGDATMALLPGLRERVRQLMESATPVPDGVEVDELDAGFARSNAQWYEAACGMAGHAFYTFATNLAAESTNSATWRPNLAATGRYRVYAYVPRGCGPTQVTERAVYRIAHAGGTSERAVNQAASDGWVDLGAYTFNAGTGGAAELKDLTGEPLSAWRGIIFDTVKWVREDAEASVRLVDVTYDRTTLVVGELLKVTFTVENTGPSTLYGQQPQANIGTSGDPGSVEAVHVYGQGQCFAGDSSGETPAFPKETSRVRLTLGMAGWDTANVGRCAGATSDYPWRWGLNEPLEPGQRQTVVGYVRMTSPGVYRLQAGVVQEYVGYQVEGAALREITVLSQQFIPIAQR